MSSRANWQQPEAQNADEEDMLAVMREEREQYGSGSGGGWDAAAAAEEYEQEEQEASDAHRMSGLVELVPGRILLGGWVRRVARHLMGQAGPFTASRDDWRHLAYTHCVTHVVNVLPPTDRRTRNGWPSDTFYTRCYADWEQRPKALLREPVRAL